MNTHNMPTTAEKAMNRLVKAAKTAYGNGTLTARDKCCGKCAFRENSTERCDPFGWESAAELWADGHIFVCHEGLPGHPQKTDGEALKVCAGWQAMSGKPLDDWLKLGYIDGRTPDTKYQAGYPYFPEEEKLDQLISDWCEPCKHFETCTLYSDASSAMAGMKGLEPAEWVHDEGGEPVCINRAIEVERPTIHE